MGDFGIFERFRFTIDRPKQSPNESTIWQRL